jgi:hypothetical protein
MSVRGDSDKVASAFDKELESKKESGFPDRELADIRMARDLAVSVATHIAGEIEVSAGGSWWLSVDADRRDSFSVNVRAVI